MVNNRRPCSRNFAGFGAVQKLYHASVTFRTLWPSATSNHGGLRPRIGGSETLMMLWPSATTNCGGFQKKRDIVFGQPLLGTAR